jgi:micrococcal nuclease
VVRGFSRGGRWSHLFNRIAFWLFLVAFGVPLIADVGIAALHQVNGDDGDCRIVSVIDGDTVSMWCAGQGISRVRLTGFDTPEKFSPQCMSEVIAAERATWALRRIVYSATALRYVTTGTDKYGRRLRAIYIDGKPLASLMIAAGHARANKGERRLGWCDR